ncbi:MAG: hypothetical protein HY782_03970 [Chloroflexi bacterium]|nr:hypothetical protein [Chloroflexota bacterium]
MAQVLLDGVRVELTPDQIIAAVRQLPARERERVRRELDTQQWRREFEQLLARVQARATKYPISETQVSEEVRIVRAQRRAKRLAQSSR